MQNSSRHWLRPRAAAGLLLVLVLRGGSVFAEPPPAPAPAELPKGSFMSSFKQSLAQDYTNEVVRGHFDVGTPPDTHRYYCLVDMKSGKAERNGVAAQLVSRHDKMTGVKGASVSFFSCADAEQRGILVTSDYFLTPELAGKVKPPAPAPPSAARSAAPVPGTAAVAAGASAAAATGTAAGAAAALPAAAAAPVPAAVPEAAPQTEVTAAYIRFVAGQNAHDRGMVGQVLLDSPDFVFGRSDGTSVWGYKEALDAFGESWRGTLKLDPQGEQLRVVSVAPGVAVLVTPVLISESAPGKTAAAVPVRWAGVFVKTRAGWRIASIFLTPNPGWRASTGG